MKGRNLSESLIPACVRLGIIIPEVEVEIIDREKTVATVKGTNSESMYEGLFLISEILRKKNIPFSSQQTNYFAGYHFILSAEDTPLIAKTDLSSGQNGLTEAIAFLGQ